ncbi:uncharacterized protein LOC128228413 [Mya arenaria]|uniref:uncharacterized protein LOC128228413 n=1 Tax=Mya arenaria TaxID=6604 RepID=UPI0022E84C21|nr:uncharacterized protein LOC128228413 [Mya arenaria]
MVYCKYTFIDTIECEFGCCTHGCCTQKQAEENDAANKHTLTIALSVVGGVVGGFMVLYIIYYLIGRGCQAARNRRKRAGQIIQQQQHQQQQLPPRQGEVPGVCLITIDIERQNPYERNRQSMRVDANPARPATAQTFLPGIIDPAHDDMFDVHRRDNRLMQPLGLLRRQNGPTIHEIPDDTNAGRDTHEQPGDGNVNTSNGRLDPPATPEVNRPSTVNDIDVANNNDSAMSTFGNVNFAFSTDEDTSKPHQGGERPWPYVSSGNTGSEMKCPGLAGLWGS